MIFGYGNWEADENAYRIAARHDMDSSELKGGGRWLGTHTGSQPGMTQIEQKCRDLEARAAWRGEDSRARLAENTMLEYGRGEFKA